MANKNQAPAYPGQNRNPSKDCPWTGFLIGKGIVSLFHSKIFSETWDGVVKQAHGVIYQEYYLNPRRTWKSLEEYLQFYNYERIHLGKYLNGMILVEKWQKYLSTVSPLKVN